MSRIEDKFEDILPSFPRVRVVMACAPYLKRIDNGTGDGILFNTKFFKK